LRHRNEAQAIFFELSGTVMLLRAGGGKLAIVAIRPAVIGTAEKMRVVAVGPADAHAAVPARIEKGANDAVVATNKNDRIESARTGHEISGLGQLALMTQEEPAATEDPVDLHPVDFGIGENAP